MRRATLNTGWIKNDEGTVIGIALGHDFCAEHEWGVKELREGLGLNGKLGVEGRTATKAPGFFRFETFNQTLPKPRGSTKPGEKAPCALLCVKGHTSAYDLDEPATGSALAKQLVGGFYANPGDSWYKPETSDIAAAWDSGGFAVLVRGKENVERLKGLAERFQALDLALADPSGFAFIRSGLSVLAPSLLAPEIKAQVLEQDQAQERLAKAAKATGIEKFLKEREKGYYALVPSWKDEEKTRVHFYLNPHQQNKYESGWYSVDELKAWANEEGPVVEKAGARQAEKRAKAEVQKPSTPRIR